MTSRKDGKMEVRAEGPVGASPPVFMPVKGKRVIARIEGIEVQGQITIVGLIGIQVRIDQPVAGYQAGEKLTIQRANLRDDDGTYPQAFAQRMAAALAKAQLDRWEGPCPKGGTHDFVLEPDDEVVCSKCLEPGPAPTTEDTMTTKTKKNAQPAAEPDPQAWNPALEAKTKARAEKAKPTKAAPELKVVETTASDEAYEPVQRGRAKPATAVKAPKAATEAPKGRKPAEAKPEAQAGLLESGVDDTKQPWGLMPRPVLRWAALAGYTADQIARAMLATGHAVSMKAVKAEMGRAKQGRTAAEPTAEQQKQFKAAAGK